jgi:hypothetical protein
MANLDLIGDSAQFRALLDNVDIVAPVDSAVLIQGETGTGKEVVARAIHEGSPRRKNRSSHSIARRYRIPCWRASSSVAKRNSREDSFTIRWCFTAVSGGIGIPFLHPATMIAIPYLA